MNRFLSTLLAMFFMMGVAQAQADRCHSLAASPTDPERKAPGVPYGKIDGATASQACELAVRKSPTDGQLWFQYGRALEKAKRVNEAISAYQRGADLDNPGAMNNLGELYRDAKGFERDVFMAEILFQNAANKNFPEADQNLATLNKFKQPAAQRVIPAKFQGKFSNSNMSCKATNENSKAFGNEFMGPQVRATTISKYMEFSCEVMNLNMINDSRADVVLKCSANSDTVYLYRLILTPAAIIYDINSDARSTRCGN